MAGRMELSDLSRSFYCHGKIGDCYNATIWLIIVAPPTEIRATPLCLFIVDCLADFKFK